MDEKPTIDVCLVVQDFVADNHEGHCPRTANWCDRQTVVDAKILATVVDRRPCYRE